MRAFLRACSSASAESRVYISGATHASASASAAAASAAAAAAAADTAQSVDERLVGGGRVRYVTTAHRYSWRSSRSTVYR